MAAQFNNQDGRIRGRALQARRLNVWSKDPRCAMCRKLCEFSAEPGRGFQLDHRVPLFKGGPDTEANCQVLCVGPDGCHDKKTADDLGYVPAVRIGEDGWPVDNPVLHGVSAKAARNHGRKNADTGKA